MNKYRCCLLFALMISATGLLPAQSYLQSSTLPIVVIQTLGDSIVDDPRIAAHMGVIQRASGLNHIGDPFNAYDGWINIELRGSSSRSFPKKSYGFETQKADGSNNNVALMGMPKENDWILHGPFSDKTLLRNRFIFELAAKLGQYASRTRFCELVINDDYQGVYVLMEKIKRDANRVDISPLEPADTDPKQITGGYILKLDKTTGSGGEGWHTPLNTFIQYEYPDPSDLNEAQSDYIQQYVNSAETMLFSQRYQDPDIGFRAWWDEASFIDFILLNELSKNVDAYRLSTFLHKDRGSKLRAGPIWDYNLAFGNANYCVGESTDGWVLNFNRSCPKDAWKINNWWNRMLMDRTFGEALITSWQTLRQEAWQNDSLMLLLDSLVTELGDAADRNFQRWNILHQWIWPNVVVMGDHPAEVNYLRNWLLDRVGWIDENITNISGDVSNGFDNQLVRLNPNPFSEYLEINLQNTQAGTYEIQLFDFLGQPVAQLYFTEKGGYESFYTWDGRDTEGKPLPTGIYFYLVIFQDKQLLHGKLIRQGGG
jgi:hypothetical protein